MFFRREKPRELTFSDQLENLRQAGFNVSDAGSGKAKIIKHGCAAMVEEAAKWPKIDTIGVVMGNEIGLLVDGGYQKFFRTASGKRLPALANHLKSLHDFQEDLKEALGMTSLYNQGLGSTCEEHIYDRVEMRDRGDAKPWKISL